MKGPKIVDAPAREVLGIRRSYTAATRILIPEQWAELMRRPDILGQQSEPVAYGVCYAGSERGFDYLAGVEVGTSGGESNAAPAGDEEVVRVRLPSGTYAVFEHDGDVSTLSQTFQAIGTSWQPPADYAVALPKVPMFERYTEAFDPKLGRGGIEVWVPLER